MKALAEQSFDDRPAYTANIEKIRAAGFGIRAFDKVMRPLINEAGKTRSAGLARNETGGFFEQAGCICRTKMTPEGQLTIQVCNFTAKIVDEVRRDDGAEVSIYFTIEGKLANGKTLPRIEIPSSEFPFPEKWLVRYWGSDPIIWPGEKNSLCAGIQALSDKKTTRSVFCHSGWRKFGSQWAYLYHGGCVSDAPIRERATVELSAPFDRFVLPPIPAADGLIKAVRASLQIIKVAPPEIAVPLLAATFRSVIDTCDFSLFFVGLTGTGKTELAALAQQHFGAEFDSRHMPGSWASTANANEALSFIAKDAIFVVDDFNPTGSSAEISRMHQAAERLLRAQGNSAGRARMKFDATLRATRHPRGLMFSTGEEVPAGHSLLARMFVKEVHRDSVIWEQMTVRQADAASGLYAQSMAGFLRFLAPQLDDWRAKRKSFCEEFRTKVNVGGHARVSSAVAELVFGWRVFLAYAKKIGAITQSDREQLIDDGQNAIVEVGRQQSQHHELSDPVEQFVHLLSSALSSGSAHVADAIGGPPTTSPGAWGWRWSTVGSGMYERDDWKPQGPRIGWIVDDNLYLDKDSSFAVAQKLAESHGRPIPMTASTLWKRARDRTPSLLKSWDEVRQRVTVRRSINRTMKEVIHARMEAIVETDESTVQSVHEVEVDGF